MLLSYYEVGNTDEELCHRWMQLAAFTPFFRNHNIRGAIPQEPYRWDSVAHATRAATAVRYALLPYWVRAPLSVYLISLMQATLLSTRSLQTRLCTARHPCAHSFLNFRKSKNYLRLTASLCLEATSWLLPCLHRTSPLFRVSPSSPLPSPFI